MIMAADVEDVRGRAKREKGRGRVKQKEID